MPSKTKKLGGYLFYLLLSNVIYGLFVYQVFTWLVGYSLLYAYLGNLLLIILGLAWDEYMQRHLQSKKLTIQLKQEKDRELNQRFVRWLMESFISFKTALYLFYVFILIISQFIKFFPELLGENAKIFISANDYSILFLIALDTMSTQFAKDRQRMKIIAKNLEKALAEDDEAS